MLHRLATAACLLSAGLLSVAGPGLHGLPGFTHYHGPAAASGESAADSYAAKSRCGHASHHPRSVCGQVAPAAVPSDREQLPDGLHAGEPSGESCCPICTYLILLRVLPAGLAVLPTGLEPVAELSVANPALVAVSLIDGKARAPPAC